MCVLIFLLFNVVIVDKYRVRDIEKAIELVDISIIYMSELLSINGTNFISASDAGKICKYTSDYITKLAREGKVAATRVGRQWYVTPDSLETFVKNNEVQKKIRSAKISAERKKEQHAFALQVMASSQNDQDHFSSLVEPAHNKFVALQQTVAILILGASLGVGGFFASSVSIPIYQQDASIVDAGFLSLERLAVTLYRFISPSEEEYYVESPENEESGTASGVAPEKQIPSNNSIVIAPSDVLTRDRVAEVRDSLSDEVEVTVDPEDPDTGLIVPVFRDRKGDEYRFLLMPINQKSTPGT